MKFWNPNHAQDQAPVFTLSRRGLLVGSGSLLIAMTLPLAKKGVAASQADSNAGVNIAQDHPNAFVRIDEDNAVTVIVKHIEFGQGAFTGLATLVAEELDADWSQMRAEHAQANAALYKNHAFGIQGVGGSTGLANSYQQMRMAGALAKQLLVQAAADAWSVPVAEITVSQGQMTHAASGKSARFGEFAKAAAALPAPTQLPELKAPSAFRLIGTNLPKLDSGIKTNGQAQFTQDMQRDGMLVATVIHPPKFGATLTSFKSNAAMKVPGVVAVEKIPSGIAVYGKSTFAALQGKAKVEAKWNTDKAEQRSSARLYQEYTAATQSPGASAAQSGDAAGAIEKAAQRFEWVYQFPYLAHAPMETLDAVVQEGKDGTVEVWMGSQLQTVDQQTIAKVFGIDPSKVTLNTLLGGGSFGRRAQQDSGLAAEAAHVAKAYGAAHGAGTPVKLIWTREDDIRGGRYRPLTVHRLRGGLDKNGNIQGWQQTIATQSIVAGSAFEGMIKNGIDPTSVEGASDFPYAISNKHVSLHTMEAGVPVLWWRSVGHTHTAYTVETFVDYLLEQAGKDPVEGRVALLPKGSREIPVLRKAAAMADAAGKIPPGRARGVAVHKSFGSFVAQVAEVSKADDGSPKVHRVWCAVDCGLAVNPDIVVAQMEGGIGFGLGSVLFEELSLGQGGEVEQANFDTYMPLRMADMPEIDVAIVSSDAPPTGVGEPGTPPIGPAVANAWRRLTGDAVTHLPFMQSVNRAAAAQGELS